MLKDKKRNSCRRPRTRAEFVVVIIAENREMTKYLKFQGEIGQYTLHLNMYMYKHRR